MGSQKRRVAILGLLIFALGSGYFLMRHSRYRATFLDICDLVEDKFYRNDRAFRRWVSSCRKQAEALPFWLSKDRFLDQVQDHMDLLHVSHFLVYSPAEDERLWAGQAMETGLRARWMEDHAVIYQVLPKSPSSDAGLREGDEIVGVNGQKIDSVENIESRAGRFEILRGHQHLAIRLTPRAIVVDSRPTLRRWDRRTGVVDLSSFRSEYFEAKKWRQFVKGWQAYPRLIVDLRENPGGNFVAMLRALSPLFCHPTMIGALKQPRRSRGRIEPLRDDIADDEQIGQLQYSKEIILKTYATYGCYRGPVAVLIGPHTASVSEIFASAMRLRPQTRIFGQPTAGDVLLAIWYDLPDLGDGYSISIPEALFVTPRQESLEGRGLQPQVAIYDRLDLWRTGVDAWIKTVAQKGTW